MAQIFASLELEIRCRKKLTANLTTCEQHITCYIEHHNADALVKLRHCIGNSHNYSTTVTQEHISGLKQYTKNAIIFCTIVWFSNDSQNIICDQNFTFIKFMLTL